MSYKTHLQFGLHYTVGRKVSGAFRPLHSWFADKYYYVQFFIHMDICIYVYMYICIYVYFGDIFDKRNGVRQAQLKTHGLRKPREADRFPASSTSLLAISVKNIRQDSNHIKTK